MTSAFAAAASQAATPPAPASAPVTNPLPFNRDNPFGKPSDFRGGDFIPTPGLENLIGRTLIYIPRTFDANAKDPFNVGKTRPQWTADLYVVDGGRLSFWYKKKGDPNATPPTQDETVEWVQEDVSPANPFISLGTWVSQAALIGKLTAASNARQFLIGTPDRGAQKAQRDKGMTDVQVRAEHAAWIARGKAGNEPKFVWILSDVGQAGLNNALAWWEMAQNTIKL